MNKTKPKQPAKQKAKASKGAPVAAPKMGRPRKEIDFNVFEGMCRAQCTLAEMAGIFDISEDTLERRIQENYGETFADTYKKKSTGGKVSLRRLQFKSAEAGNVTMQIWLGKQYLGQADKQELTGNEGAPLLQPLAAALNKIYGDSE